LIENSKDKPHNAINVFKPSGSGSNTDGLIRDYEIIRERNGVSNYIDASVSKSIKFSDEWALTFFPRK
jgi:hypothetical protein